jgi:hypothetical protein
MGVAMSDPVQNASRINVSADALWVFALAVWSVVATGHNFAVGNHTGYLLWIERLRDPGFLSADWYMATSTLHPNIVGPLRLLADALGEANAFLLALVVSRLVLTGGVWGLARALGAGRVGATLGVVLVILAPRVSWGAHYPSGAYFEASHFGVALAAVAMAFLARGRPAAAGAMVGLTGHFHLFLGAHLGAIASLAVLLGGGRWGGRWARWARMAVPALLLSSYTLWTAASGYFGASGGEGLSGREIVEILAFRHPHHHSPLSWELLPSLEFGAYLALGALLAWRAGRWRSPLFMALFGYGALSCVVGTVFVEWVPVSLVAVVQFFRVTTLLIVWVAVETALWLVGLFFASIGQGRWGVTGLAAVAAAGFRKPEFFLPCAAALLVVEKWRGLAPDEPSGSKSGASSPPRTVRWRVNPLTISALFAAAGVGALGLGAAGMLNPAMARLGRAEHFRRSVESSGANTRAVCDWVRRNTPPDAVFLEPPSLEGFQLYARRADVANFKQMTFTPPELREWFERICAISRLGRLAEGLDDARWGDAEAVLPHLHAIRRQGIHPQVALDEGFLTLSSAEVHDLAARYGIDYFITPSREPYDFALAGEAGGCRVYRTDRGRD